MNQILLTFFFSTITFHPITSQTIPQCQFGIDAAKESAKAVSVFAVQMYKLLAQPDENVIFSPSSIALALALVESGTGGETRKEIQPLLTFPGSAQNGSSQLFQALQHQILHPDAVSKGGKVFFDYGDYGNVPVEKGKLSIANGFFRADDFTLKGDYENTIKECFDTEIAKAPFASKTEEARNQVNRWVSDATGGKITELFKPQSITENTVAILANAIYMKAFWPTPFEKSSFENLPFYQSGKTDRPQNVTFMTKFTKFTYISKENYHVVDLPYRDSGLSMYIILPKEQDGMETVEKSLNGQELLSLFGGPSEYRKVVFKMPKFTIRQSVDLIPTLKKLGVEKMFLSEADFSNMADRNGIRISKALHEAYIKVNENGTEAAAVTAFGLLGTSARFPPTEPPPVIFTADHPFIYAIVHRPTSAIVFMGKVNSVKQEE